MARGASELACRLAREAEAVCRHYLSNGRRQGNYWLVGDVENTPGRSMFVRLKGGESGKGAAGKWTEFGEGQLWRSARRHSWELRPCRLPRGHGRGSALSSACHDRHQNRNGAVGTHRRRLGCRNWRGDCSPCRGRSPALSRKPNPRNRGVTDLHGTANLRFHSRCYYRPDHDAPTRLGRP